MRRLLLILLVTTPLAAAPIVDLARHEIRFTAVVHPKAMDRPFGVKGHHAIVWKDGRASTWALFVSDESDHDVRVALQRIGASPGENLTPDSWNERDNPRSAEPDKRVAGTPLTVFVEWRGSRGRIPLASLIAEEGHAAPRIDLRFGGNEKWQKEFHSGCIVCLYSCPGGAVGNHAHPIRDYVRDGVVYSSIPSRLPASGTRVTIIMRVRMEGS